MKVTINDNAFKGAKHFNGAIATLDEDKETGEPIKGKSGETLRFSLVGSGGCVFLSEDQYTKVD